MNEPNDWESVVGVLRERLSALSAASLRISASLDLQTVLDEVAQTARVLTGARYAAIATIDEAGAPVDFVTSGFTEEAHRAMAEWTDGPRLFEHFRDLDGPLRIADVPGYVRDLGFSPERLPWGTFQGTPMRHGGVHVGNFYLVEKEDGAAFTREDEELLVLFGSQAATAIANARTYRAERRARADLEALVETSPVGVVVFDAASGRAASVNREARRIVESLRMPGRPAEDLLGIATCRFADGREIALKELPLPGVLSGALAVRGEEIELSVPDGRSIATLVNATPIRGEHGAVSSVVVTLQDLAPLRELERMRADFLGMVSHELRTPLAAVKGATATVLAAPERFGEAEKRQFFRIVDEQAERMSDLIGDLLDAGRIEAGTLPVAPEPSVVTVLVDRARTAFLSGGGGHSVLIDVPSDLPRVLADPRRIVQVLNNLLANAARHSPGTTAIRITAQREDVHVAVSVSDTGQGIAPERLGQLFRKYAGDETSSGGGLGLWICKGLVEAHGGRIRAESPGLGQGTRVTFTVPVAERDGGPAEADVTVRCSGAPPRRGAGPVLVVDDDPEMLRYMRETLAGAGYAPLVTAESGNIGRIIRAERPRLVLLDLMLSGTDGIDLMGSVRELSELPVIFVSAYGRDETVSRALEAGAVDYIVKPFSPMELIARIGAALRRRDDAEPFVLGDLAIDYARREVSVGGRAVALTPSEYGVLYVLSQTPGRVVTFGTLLNRVWRKDRNGDPKLVRAVVKRLRSKLGEDGARPRWILNVRGVGYRVAGSPESSARPIRPTTR